MKKTYPTTAEIESLVAWIKSHGNKAFFNRETGKIEVLSDYSLGEEDGSITRGFQIDKIEPKLKLARELLGY